MLMCQTCAQHLPEYEMSICKNCERNFKSFEKNKKTVYCASVALGSLLCCMLLFVVVGVIAMKYL